MTREVCKFLKSRLIFILFHCFWMFVNKLFTYPYAHISKCQGCFNVKSSTYYFHVKRKIFVDFQIFISVPLRISSVNVTKSSFSSRFGHIYWENLNGKVHFCTVNGVVLEIYYGSQISVAIGEFNAVHTMQLPNPLGYNK